jgi:lysine 2,3-aminomutase
VLLKGVNDSEEALKNLFHGLLKLRVRPYYLYQCDPVVALHICGRASKQVSI